MIKQQRKVFVIDTSVLLYDHASIHGFPDCDVVIPMVVLDELDRFKDKDGIVGENARYVNRFLDSLRSQGNLNDGVALESNNQTIKVVTGDILRIPDGLDSSSNDNKIIGLACQLKNARKAPVIVVTKDINFRVKCDALKIKSEDYYKDNIPKNIDLYTGCSITQLSSEQINRLHEEKVLTEYKSDTCPNEFSIITSVTDQKHSVLAIRKKHGLIKVPDVILSQVQVRPRNKEQSFAIYLLLDDNVPLVTLTGIAGSGKTFLALMSGWDGVWADKYKRLVITRPVVPVGRDLGYLPGSIEEKMSPWLLPIIDNFRDGIDDQSPAYFEAMCKKGQIEIAPLSYIRGRTLNNCFMIVDEAQNATVHELKTVITRMGRNSKLVLLGDTDQVDTPYIDSRSNGLSIVVERFKNEWAAGHIQLPKGERSELASLASRIL